MKLNKSELKEVKLDKVECGVVVFWDSKAFINSLA